VNAILEQCPNIVFDVGQVILRFDPPSFLPDVLRPEQLEVLTPAAFFGTETWTKVDAGTIEEKEAARVIASSVSHPEWTDDVYHIITHYQDHMPLLPTVDLIPKLKAMGKKLYVLSNYGPLSFERARKMHEDVFDQFDGLVVSGVEHINKPDPRLYRILLDRYQLDPAATVFIDDNPANIAAAKAIGMHGIVYTGIDCLL